MDDFIKLDDLLEVLLLKEELSLNMNGRLQSMADRSDDKVSIMKCNIPISVLVIIGLSALLISCDKSYMHLPQKKHSFIVIDKENGIRNLCDVNSALSSAFDRLGRPDHYYNTDPGDCLFGIDIYQYYDFGLSVGAHDDKVHALKIRINADSIERIRFYDEKELKLPVTIDRVHKLYGLPEKEHDSFFQQVYYFKDMYYKFVFVNDELKHLSIRAIGW